MIPFSGDCTQAASAAARVHKELRRKRLICMPANSIEVAVSPLTGAFLQDLTEIALVHFGEDPLAGFDTPVALLQSHPFACEVDTEDGVIFVSDSFLEALEFAASQASLVNLMSKIKKSLSEFGEQKNHLLEGINSASNALHSMYMARMLLHVIGEKTAPPIARVLPKEYKLFVHRQMVAAAIYALLHEQAHLEIKAGRLKAELNISLEDAFCDLPHSEEQIEEYTCDLWAAQQLKGDRGDSFVRAACFFFFNQWVVDYLLHNEEAIHPPAFNRIQHLMIALPYMKEEDINFFNMMTKELNGQQQLRQALKIKSQSERYAALLKYSRACGSYEHYEELVEALSRIYEELGLKISA